MKKSLQILLGLILILILAYLCFIRVSSNIKNDLISKTELIYKENNITGVTVEIEGEDLSMRRVLVLTGTISSYKKKVDAEIFAKNIDGVLSVKNSIVIDIAVDRKPKPTIVYIKEPEEVIVTPIETAKPIPTPKNTPTIKPTNKPTEIIIKSTPKASVEGKIDIPIPIDAPIAIKNTVNIPTPVDVPKTPIAIQSAIIEENEETKLKTKGVE